MRTKTLLYTPTKGLTKCVQGREARGVVQGEVWAKSIRDGNKMEQVVEMSVTVKNSQ